MEEGAKAHLPVFVLDRPNPIGGVEVEGPVADMDKHSFTAYHAIPVRHAMTVGELAQLFNEHRGIGFDCPRNQDGRRDLRARSIASRDVLAASGATPYTMGAVSYARRLSAFTVAITCAPQSPITKVAEVSLVPVFGSEIIAGSTRLKAGTAQKMVLNMLSTAALVKLGYVSGNRMSNLQAHNAKLRARAIRILMAETGLSEDAAATALDAANGDTKLALVMTRVGCGPEAAKKALANSKGVVQEAVNQFSKQKLGDL